MSQKRLSNIELLRIISILLIVSMHVIGSAFHTSNVLNKELLLFVNTIGNTGVTIFILISGYFGIHFKSDKLLKLLAVVWFYSITSFIADVTIFGSHISIQSIASAFIPIMSKKYWFITCYIILYCFSPYLNKIVSTLSKKDFEKMIFIWGLFFILAPTFVFFEIENDGGKGVVNIFLSYLIGNYLSVYGFPKIVRQKSSILLTILFASIFVLNSLLTEASGNIVLRFARDNNLLILLASIVILNIFLEHKFYSDITNYLAGFVFPLYLIQAFLTKNFYSYISQYINDNTFIIFVIAEILAITLISIIVESARRLLFSKVEDRVAIAANKKINFLWNRKFL